MATGKVAAQITASENVADDIIKLKQEQWITFCALGGLITNESDNENKTQEIRQMTVTEFSEQLGVHRVTLYKWKRSIPNFGDRVRTARNEVFSLSRETTLFNRAYIIAMSSNDHKAAGDMIKMLLGHGANLELPTQRTEIDAGQNLMELVGVARKKQVVEGEVSDE